MACVLLRLTTGPYVQLVTVLRKMVEVNRFWCLLLDDDVIEPFFVDIDLDQMVLELKEAIRFSKNRMRQYDAEDITLYKVSTFQAN